MAESFNNMSYVTINYIARVTRENKRHSLRMLRDREDT